MLPNLPLLTDAWQWGQIEVALDPANWVQVLPQDACRWYVTISVPNFSSFLVSTFVDTTFDSGLLVVNGNMLEWKYKDIGPVCQQELFVYGKGSVGNCTIIWASIIKPGG